MTINHYLIELDIRLLDDASEDQVEDLVDALAEQVSELGDGIDGDVSASISARTVTIYLPLDDQDDESAFARGVAAARTAVHAAGGPTPGWETITLQPTPNDLAAC